MSWKIRSWCCGIAASGLLWSAAPVHAADKIVWNLSVWGNPRGFTRGIEEMAKLADQGSGGNFTIKIHYGSTVSPEKENLDALKVGAIEAAMICSFYHPGKNPILSALDLPFLPILDIDANHDVKAAYYAHPEAVKEGEKWNAMWFFPAVVPRFEFMGIGKAPRELGDWQGMRIRAPGGIGEALARIGAVPSSGTASEAYTGLERGVFQATAFPFSYSFASYRIDEVAKWYTWNLAPGTSNCLMANSLSAWKSLPDEYRRLMEEARRPAFEAMKAAYVAADEKYIPEWDRRGLERVVYSDGQRQGFIDRAARPIWDAWVSDMESKGYPGRELLDFILSESGKHQKAR